MGFLGRKPPAHQPTPWGPTYGNPSTYGSAPNPGGNPPPPPPPPFNPIGAGVQGQPIGGAGLSYGPPDTPPTPPPQQYQSPYVQQQQFQPAQHLLQPAAKAGVSVGHIAAAVGALVVVAAAVVGVVALTHQHATPQVHQTQRAAVAAAFGDVPVGNYQASDMISTSFAVPGAKTGWTNIGVPGQITAAQGSDFAKEITSLQTTIQSECATEAAALGASLTCKLSYQPWNGTYFGLTIGIVGSATSGGVTSSGSFSAAMRFTKV